MAKDPADRYADGGELSRELEAFMSGRMISAQKAGLAALAGRWLTRRLGALAALVVAAAAVTLAGLKVADWVQAAGGRREQHLESARARYERGMADFGAKNYAGAAENLAAAVVGGLEDEPGLRAGYALAVSLHELGREVAAERAFGDLVSRYPGRPEGWHGRGYVRYCLKSYEAARADFAKAVALSPENAGYRYCLGMAAWGSGDRKAAEAEISRALELSPGNEKWRAHLDALRAEMKTPRH
jgi:tetratricopeptide (TPR) repeat protein